MKVMNDNEKKKISELVEELEKVKADCAALQLEVKNVSLLGVYRNTWALYVGSSLLF